MISSPLIACVFILMLATDKMLTDRIRTLDTLTERRRTHKWMRFRGQERRDKMLAEQKGVEAYLQLATPHPWTATLEFALPVPTQRGHFHEQAQQIQQELSDLFGHELDLDNTEYVGIGNDREGVKNRIAQLEGHLELRVNQENLLHTLSKRELLSPFLTLNSNTVTRGFRAWASSRNPARAKRTSSSF